MNKDREKLLEVSTIKIKGVKFKIRAVSAQDFVGVSGNPFNPYRNARSRQGDDKEQKDFEAKLQDPSKIEEVVEEMKKAYVPIFLKAVISPKLDEKGGVTVDDLFVDIRVAVELYHAITSLNLKKNNFITSLWRRLFTST